MDKPNFSAWSDERVYKELAFARGFSYPKEVDKLVQEWVEYLEQEAKKRGLIGKDEPLLAQIGKDERCPKCDGQLVIDDTTATVYCESNPDHFSFSEVK